MLPLPDPTIELRELQQAAIQIGQFLYQAFVPCLRIIGQYALQLGLAMAGLGLAFGGRGRAIASVFVEICVLSAIVWVFCVGMWPQTLLGNLRSAMLTPAIQLGNQIAHYAGVQGDTPTQWLMSWINNGPPNAPMDLAGRDSNCKFSIRWVEDVLWPDANYPPGKAEESLEIGSANVGDVLRRSSDQNNAWSIGLWSATFFGLGSIFTAMLGAYLTAIISIFVFALTQLFVLGGGELAWDLYIPLGMLLIPLIYLGIGRDYWRHYLTTLVALAILPAMYWIMAGIGIAILVALWNAIFGLGALGSVGMFIRGAVNYATGGLYTSVWTMINQLLSNGPGGGLLGGLGGLGFPLTQFLQWIYGITGFFLRYATGVGVVAAFTMIATTIAVTSVQIAFSWTRAFSDAAGAWIGAHRDHIDRIGGAVSSGIGQMAGGAVQQIGDFFRGLRRPR